jgi:predicted RNase H-like nuclease (RuvC/YqgF family)
LRDRLAEAEREQRNGDDRDNELSDLRKKLSEARAKAREVEPELAARQREIKVSWWVVHGIKTGGSSDLRLSDQKRVFKYAMGCGGYYGEGGVIGG